LAILSVEKAIGRKSAASSQFGGGAASDLWRHILADITGKDICLPRNTEASALGAAIAAAVGRAGTPLSESGKCNDRDLQNDKTGFR